MRISAGAFFLFVGVLLFAGVNAMYLSVQGPVSKTLYNNGGVYLGKIAPGESFYVLANSTTTNPQGTYINIGWDTLQALNLPAAWSSQPSPLYENPMKLKVTVSSNAQYGVYNLTIRAVNIQNYSGLGNLTVYARVNVTPNVLNLNVAPTGLGSGIGQPANLYIRINNTGISDDPFIIKAVGLPAWNISEQVISLHAQVNTFTYPVFVDQPGVYNFNLTVGSTTSQLIQKTYPITLTIRESLLNDYNAVGSGVVLSPLIFEPAYALMSLLSYIARLITH